MKTTKRLVICICNQCLGVGTVGRNGGRVKCPGCNGTGNVERVLNEVHSEEGTNE